jgi:hypothetical protein
VNVVRSSALRNGRLYSQEFSWYSLLEAESPPGRMVPSVRPEKIPTDTTGDRSRDPPFSSTVVHYKLCINKEQSNVVINNLYLYVKCDTVQANSGM